MSKNSSIAGANPKIFLSLNLGNKHHSAFSKRPRYNPVIKRFTIEDKKKMPSSRPAFQPEVVVFSRISDHVPVLMSSSLCESVNIKKPYKKWHSAKERHPSKRCGIKKNFSFYRKVSKALVEDLKKKWETMELWEDEEWEGQEYWLTPEEIIDIKGEAVIEEFERSEYKNSHYKNVS